SSSMTSRAKSKPRREPINQSSGTRHEAAGPVHDDRPAIFRDGGNRRRRDTKDARSAPRVASAARQHHGDGVGGD
ncbi:hypothetical protein C6T71_01195, partial [Burkholderia multivorans]